MPKIKLDRDDDGDLDSTASFIQSNIDYIYSLQPDFIVFYRDELCAMITSSPNKTLTEKIKLLNFVRNIKDKEQECMEIID